MRHGQKHNHLGRNASHRQAMLSNLASSLILYKRIETTLPKARELRKYVEPLLTKAKVDSTHSRRTVFSYLQNKEVVQELFGPVSEKIATRPGGYTRIIKLGARSGDNADMAIIELVDFNELMLTEAKPEKAGRTRRSRRGGSVAGTTVASATVAATPAATAEEASEEATTSYGDLAMAPIAEIAAEEPTSQVDEVIAQANETEGGTATGDEAVATDDTQAGSPAQDEPTPGTAEGENEQQA